MALPGVTPVKLARATASASPIGPPQPCATVLTALSGCARQSFSNTCRGHSSVGVYWHFLLIGGYDAGMDDYPFCAKCNPHPNCYYTCTKCKRPAAAPASKTKKVPVFKPPATAKSAIQTSVTTFFGRTK